VDLGAFIFGVKQRLVFSEDRDFFRVKVLTFPRPALLLSSASRKALTFRRFVVLSSSGSSKVLTFRRIAFVISGCWFMQVTPANVKRIRIEYDTDYILSNRWRNICTFCISGIYIATLLRQDESYICCNAGKGLMPKKLRPAVDLMAFKFRTLKVKPTNVMVNFNFLLLLQVNTGVMSILHPFLSIIYRLSYH
jgi:hypothetical protein